MLSKAMPDEPEAEVPPKPEKIEAQASTPASEPASDLGLGDVQQQFVFDIFDCRQTASIQTDDVSSKLCDEGMVR